LAEEGGKGQRASIADIMDSLSERPIAGFLQNLSGELAQYNQRLVRPTRVKHKTQEEDMQGERFLVCIEDIQLVVGVNNFNRIVDRDHVPKSAELMKQLEKKKSHTSGNNRGSAKVSMLSLSTIIRTALKKMGGDLRECFSKVRDSARWTHSARSTRLAAFCCTRPLSPSPSPSLSLSLSLIFARCTSAHSLSLLADSLTLLLSYSLMLSYSHTLILSYSHPRRS
jgi:hypothetical protein